MLGLKKGGLNETIHIPCLPLTAAFIEVCKHFTKLPTILDPPAVSLHLTLNSTMLSKLSVLAFASAVLAQSNGTVPSLAQALNSSSQLSSLSGVLALPGLSALVQSLSSAQNVTILAPSNEAFAQVDNQTLAALTANEGLLTALLQYHVLNGSILSSAITNQSQFVPTLLTNQLFTNVTGGQVVEAVASGGNVTFFSGLLSNSSVTQAVYPPLLQTRSPY